MVNDHNPANEYNAQVILSHLEANMMGEFYSI